MTSKLEDIKSSLTILWSAETTIKNVAISEKRYD
jgi:hypothetical protein